jgi:hypothetical protein
VDFARQEQGDEHKERAAMAGIQRLEFFLAAGMTNLGLTKMRSTQAHSGL